MLREIKNCPLVAILRNGGTFLFSHDVTVKGVITLELTLETIATIATEMFLKGIDIVSVSVDEGKMNYEGIEVL